MEIEDRLKEKKHMIKTAKIINTRGLKGECKVYLYTDDAEHRFEKGRILYLEQNQPLKVLNYSESKGLGFVKFEGIDSIEKAEKLKNKTLYIPKEDLPEPEEDEYYYHELNGCQVFNEQKEDLGTVTDILETGANLVLRVSKGKESFLLPFVKAFVPEVDIESKKITVHEMEGLRPKKEQNASKKEKKTQKPENHDFKNSDPENGEEA